VKAILLFVSSLTHGETFLFQYTHRRIARGCPNPLTRWRMISNLRKWCREEFTRRSSSPFSPFLRRYSDVKEREIPSLF